jgi:UPF0716 protein FxsA
MLIVLLVFVVAPVVDLYLLYRIGEAWGFLRTAALVLGSAALGIAVLRAHARRALEAARNPLALARGVAGGALDGVAAVAGGVLLILPGPITDVMGLLLQVPPIRRLLLRLGHRSVERAVDRGTMRISVLRWDPMGGPVGGDVEGEPAPSGLDPSKEIRLPPKSSGA